jgi:hypothetical protein
MPATQFFPAGHWVPQVPQSLELVSRLEQTPAQSTVPEGHVQVLFWQMRLPPQTSEQREQWVLLLLRLAHVAPHWVKPDAVQRTAQVPSLQIGAVPGQA